MLPGISALALFASLLSLVVTATAGRAFSACSGVYVAASLGWLRRVGGVEPDRWDLAGATIYFVSAAVILLGQCAVEAIALRSKSGEAQTN